MSNIEFKGYVNIKNSLHRLSYKSFLTMGREYVEYQLEFSLMFDGRYYGAEMFEEYDTLAQMAGMFSHLVEQPFDAVKAVREIRDNA